MVSLANLGLDHFKARTDAVRRATVPGISLSGETTAEERSRTNLYTNHKRLCR
jgi:hypothetical protein